MIELLDKSDPQAPTTALRYGRVTTVRPTLVKINHLKNCLLCHDPSRSSSTDLVRGRVPSESQPLPPPDQYYGDSAPGLFVRAEMTYLRQDFSVTQPVEDADPWPTHQRFDYLLLDRRVPGLDQDEPQPESARSYPQRESVLFALRELTGKNPGTTSDAWRSALQAARPDPMEETEEP